MLFYFTILILNYIDLPNRVDKSCSLLSHDGVELLEVEVVVVVGAVDNVGVVHHLSQVLVVHGLAQLSGNSLEALEVDVAVSLLVPDLEHSGQSFAGFAVAHFRADDLEELVEIDGFVDVLEAVDDLEDDFASALQAQLLEDGLDFDWVDGSSSVLIEQVEGGFELVVVVLAESVLPAGLAGDFGWGCTLAAGCWGWSTCLAVFHIKISKD